mgnify:CR=1 FL=1
MAASLTLDDLRKAQCAVNASPHVRRTPLIDANVPLGGAESSVFLKLESLQKTGSFKIRGMCALFDHFEEEIKQKGCVTLSAGNAGKSFAYLAGNLGVKNTVCMPDTVPEDRVKGLEAMGAEVVLCSNEGLMPKVNEYVAQGRVLAHPFDSAELMAGHASVGLEILEDCADADIIAVCCGGGGLVGGVAAAVKLSKSNARVYAVEPVGASCLYNSFEEGKAAHISPKTIAHGLAPPFAGELCYEYAKEFVDKVVLVSDEELVEATRFAYSNGILAETSGCAGIAALMFGKIPEDCAGKKVVCVVSGSNISPEDLQEALAGKATAH